MFRNTLYNLLGLGLPLVVAIVTIPVLIASLGIDRFGILTLIWAVVSYFGLFDLGMGRALTRHLAETWAQGDKEQAERLVSTGLVVMAGLGFAAGILLALGAEWSIRQLSGVTDLRETVNAVYAMSVAIPFIILTSGLRGILEARHAFAVVNAIRLPMGVYTFVAPVVVVKYWGNDLGLIAASLTFGRLIAFLAHAWFCYRLLPDVKHWFRIDPSVTKILFHTGKWMTVSNLLSPLMVYLDRPFSVGDWIRSPDREIEGTVERIGWRLTVIRTFDKRPLYVPNSVFANIAVENPSRMTNRRIYETIGIRYADVDKMELITADVESMLRQHPEIDTSHTLMVNFVSFAPSSMDFFVYTFTKTTVWTEFHKIKQDVLLKIEDIISGHGAEIAFPTSTVHVPDGVDMRNIGDVSVEPG